ncbi:hypothetical protein M408DRAFT_249748 [Serendipita vermifera MAFF 305830]|uniref:Dymeclin n=1 Tax=Serendipita vermifera MAFF 305830 TaxID=933852 RepID=A0A0C3AGH2_SERVB|nr:hypothetical protein M408DRAFT_249748 [Serendipita vermifera MAFF 305830]
MFTLPKLPAQLPDAFGLLGDGAKLNFRTSETGVRRLAEYKNISPTDDAYWSQYLTLFDSASDVFTLISSNDIYRALLVCPQNVSTLLHYLISKLVMLKGDHTFPSPPPSISSTLNPLKSLPISITGNGNSRNPTKEALNCIRVLSRVLPVVFGLETGGSWEDEILWKKGATPRTSPGEYGASTAGETDDSNPQFVIEDEDDDEAHTPMLPRTPQTATGASQGGPSLAERLIDTLVDLLFCCGFTLPVKAQIDHHKFQHIIWEKGVGSTFTPSATSREQAYIDNNRTEVLRLLLVLLSKQIYNSPASNLTTPTRYAQYFVQKVPRKLVLTTLCSLLNVIVNSPLNQAQTGGISAGIAGVGKGISKGLNQLPYTQGWNGDDARESLISISVQALVVLLDYQSSSARDSVSSGGSLPVESAVMSPISPSTSHPPPMTPMSGQRPEDRAPSPKTNHFRYFLSKIHRPADLKYLLDGILAVLGEELIKRSGLLSMGLGALEGVGVKSRPTSSRPSMQEVLILLWKLFDINRKFRAYVVEGDRAVDVMALILCYCLELKDKPKSNGICRALSYMLQSLSAEPSFGTQLSHTPIRIALPSKWNVVGTAAEFFISAIYFIVSNSTTFGSSSNTGPSPGVFSSLYPALIISIANVAPYLKNLSVSSSNKLIHLAAAFADPRLLFAEEGNPRLVYFMLDAIVSILYRHPSENPNLLYSLLRTHVVFQDLGTLTLSQGLREIKRREEEEKETNSRVPGKRLSRDRDPLAEQAHEEKARMLAAEGLSSPSAEGLAHEAANSGPLANTLLTSSVDSLTIVSPSTGTSSWAEHGATSSSSLAEVSEKARGKMRQTTESVDVTSSVERAAAVAVGRNGFVPTQEWVTSWQQALPLDPILLTISELLPKIQEIQVSMNRQSTSPAALDFLRVVDFKSILPQRSPVSPRPFVWTDSSIVWLTSLIWGEVYVQNMSPLGIWNNTNVRLFYVKQAQAQPRQITETVSNVMGGFLGRRDSTNRGRA